MFKILALFLTSRLVFLIFAYLAIIFIPLHEGYLAKKHYAEIPNLIWEWANFDGRHYLTIAREGYNNFEFAFFPLYPALVSLVHSIVDIRRLYIGILISLLSFLAAMFVIKKIIRLDFKERIATSSLFFLSFFPLAFFYNAVYADSLFLLSSSLSFYFARKGNWVLSGTFGCLSTLTRLAGLALVPALALEWYLQNPKKTKEWGQTIIAFLRKAAIAPALTISGLGLYMLYLQIFHGDWFLFQRSMVAWNQHEFTLLPQVMFRYLKIFLLVEKDLLVYWVAVLEFVSFFLYMGLAFYVAKKIRLSYGVFMVALLFLVTFTGTLAGTPRYILHLFPAFLGMALLFEKRKVLSFVVFILFLALGAILTGLFTRGYFVA